MKATSRVTCRRVYGHEDTHSCEGAYYRHIRSTWGITDPSSTRLRIRLTMNEGEPSSFFTLPITGFTSEKSCTPKSLSEHTRPSAKPWKRGWQSGTSSTSTTRNFTWTVRAFSMSAWLSKSWGGNSDKVRASALYMRATCRVFHRDRRQISHPHVLRDQNLAGLFTTGVPQCRILHLKERSSQQSAGLCVEVNVGILADGPDPHVVVGIGENKHTMSHDRTGAVDWGGSSKDTSPGATSHNH